MAVPESIDGVPLGERDRREVERAVALLHRRDAEITDAQALSAALDAFRARHEVVAGAWRRRGRAQLSGPDAVVIDLTRSGAG